MRATKHPDAVFLAGSFTDADLRQVQQLVFGHMVKLAAPTVTAYHSDFFHDATWIRDNLVGQEFTFFYAFNESGTAIGTDQELVTAYRKNQYKMVAFIERDCAFLQVTDITPQPEVVILHIGGNIGG